MPSVIDRTGLILKEGFWVKPFRPKRVGINNKQKKKMKAIEEWKPITGYEEMYEVSNLGRIKNSRNGRIKKSGPGGRGNYKKVDLYKNGEYKKCYVHRLVAEAFIPNPDNLPEVNHKDENGFNNNVDNLEWYTPKQNSNYGTRNKRIGAKNSKQVAQYTLDLPCELIKVWPSACEVERELGINHQSISMCCNGKLKQAGGFTWSFYQIP